MAPEKPRYASLGSRFLALTMDFILLSALFFPITKIVKGVWIMTPADHNWQIGVFISDPLCVIFLIAIFAYFILLEGALGFTMGKKLLHLRVEQKDGRRIGMKRALVRNLFRLIDGLPAFSLLGIILILSTAENTRLGDIVAGSRVVNQDYKRSALGAY